MSRYALYYIRLALIKTGNAMKNSCLMSLFPGLFLLTIFSCDVIDTQSDEGESEVFERRELPRELSSSEQQLVDGSGAFGFELMKLITDSHSGKNHFISPISISLAYGMLLNGADRETFVQISEVLGIDELDRNEINEAAYNLITLMQEFDDQVDFNIANAIWYRDTFDVEHDFLSANQQFYDAVVEKADFSDPATVDEINSWVKNKTEGLIDSIVEEPIDPLTVMYLINAIYFNGDWTYPFDPDLTSAKPFFLADGTESEADMMQLEATENMEHYSGQDYQAVNLYYGDAGFVMTLVLPDADVNVEQWLKQMDWEEWKHLTDSFNRVTLELEIPKFEKEYEVEDFPELLESMGMVNAFDPSLSDFSLINPDQKDLFVSDSRHKTFISLDEEGTEAAAVTSVEISTTSAPQHVQLRLDRPFFYMIREVETNTPLFMGITNDPSDSRD